jgi:hypothetical protein
LAHDQTLVQVRERTFLDVLDLAMEVVRRRPLTLGLAALVGAAPFAALNAMLMAMPQFPAGALIYLLVMEAPWATAPLTIVLGGLMFGERPSAWRVFRTLARSFFPMLIFQLVVRGVFVVTTILILLVPTQMSFLNEVILLERGRWYSGFRRCSKLTEGRRGEFLGQWLAQVAFGAAFVLAFWAGTGALWSMLFTSDPTWQPVLSELVGVRFHLALWLAIEFFAVARFFSYIDQRIRLEGWEVRLRVSAAGRVLEDEARW